MQQQAPLQNRRSSDNKPEQLSDRLARRFTQVMIGLILAGVSATFFKFLEWTTLAWSLVPVVLGLFLWLVVIIIRLDNALREETGKDDDNSGPPLAPA